MAIQMTCRCGAKFVAKPELAGKRVSCPTCGHGMAVPAASDAASADPLAAPGDGDDPLGLGGLGEPLPPDDPLAGYVPSPTLGVPQPAQKRREPKQGSRVPLIVAASVSGVVVCGALVVLAVVLLGSGSNEPAEGDGVAGSGVDGPADLAANSEYAAESAEESSPGDSSDSDSNATSPAPPRPQSPEEEFAGLLEALESSDAKTRVLAARRLGELGPAATDAVPKLAELLDDPGVWSTDLVGNIPVETKSSRVVNSLGEVVSESKTIVTKRGVVGSATHGVVASEAETALLAIGGEPVAQVLLERVVRDFGSPAQARRKQSRLASMLATLPAQYVVPGLIKVLQEGDDSARTIALQALAYFGPAARSATPVLHQILEADLSEGSKPESMEWQDWGEKKRFAAGAATVLARIGEPAKATVPTLTRVVELAPSREWTQASIRALEAMGPAARSARYTLMGFQGGINERAAALEALAAIVPDETALAGIGARLFEDDKTHATLLTAAMALPGTVHDEHVLRRTITRRDSASGVLFHALLDGLRRTPPEDIQPLLALLKENAAADPEKGRVDASQETWRRNVRVKTIRALGAAGPAAKDAVPVLCDRLENSRPGSDEWSACVTALGEIGPPAAEGAALLREAPKRGPGYINVLRSLFRITGDSELVVTSVAAAMERERNAAVRTSLLRLLAELDLEASGAASQMNVWLDQSLQGRDPQTSLYAACALLHAGGNKARVVEGIHHFIDNTLLHELEADDLELLRSMTVQLGGEAAVVLPKLRQWVGLPRSSQNVLCDLLHAPELGYSDYGEVPPVEIAAAARDDVVEEVPQDQPPTAEEIAQVIAALEDTEPQLEQAELLGRAGPAASAALPLLNRHFSKAKNPQLKFYLARAAILIDPAVGRRLVRKLDEEYGLNPVAHLQLDPDSEAASKKLAAYAEQLAVRSRSVSNTDKEFAAQVKAIGMLGETGRPAVAGLRVIAAGDSAVNGVAAWSWAMIDGPRAAEAYPPLAETLDGILRNFIPNRKGLEAESKGNRRVYRHLTVPECLQAIERLGPSVKREAAPLLLEFLGSVWMGVPEYRVAAQRALAALDRPAASVGAGTERRQWTDRSGDYTVEAEFVALRDGNVELRKQDGSIITVPQSRLSDADQQWLRARLSDTPR